MAGLIDKEPKVWNIDTKLVSRWIDITALTSIYRGDNGENEEEINAMNSTKVNIDDENQQLLQVRKCCTIS